jgi:hypothetical protein
MEKPETDWYIVRVATVFYRDGPMIKVIKGLFEKIKHEKALSYPLRLIRCLSSPLSKTNTSSSGFRPL